MLTDETFTAADEQLVAGAAVHTEGSVFERPVRVGDIFESSWGYDQTNIDYYLVQEVTKSGKSVRVVRIGQTTTDRRGPAGDRVIPDPTVILDEPELHRLGTSFQGRPSIKVRYWGVWAYRWEGTSRYQTDPMWGH